MPKLDDTQKREMAERAQIMERSGFYASAKALRDKLRACGYTDMDNEDNHDDHASPRTNDDDDDDD